MLSARYKGLRVAVSDAAMREGKTLFDVVEILEDGHDAPRKRKSGTVERWLDKGAKTYCAVVAEDYNEIMKERVWLLIHFGKFSRKRRK